MRGRAVITVALIVGSCLLGQGCRSVPVETGAGVEARYVWDVLEAQLDVPIDAVYRAASLTVEDLDLTVLWDDQDGVAAKISTLDAQREHITIELEALPEARTVMTIRAGVFGDQNKSAVVFERVLENLGRQTAAARRAG